MGGQTQLNGIASPWLQKKRFEVATPYIRGSRILDIGASQGEVLEYLSGDVDYIGVEGNPEYCRNARVRWPGYRFIQLYLDADTVNTLEVPERDTILMCAVVEHMNDPERVLGGLRRFIPERGRIIVTSPTPLADRILHAGSRIGIFSREMDEHTQCFTHDELVRMCRRSGLSVIVCTRFEFGLNTLLVCEA